MRRAFVLLAWMALALVSMATAASTRSAEAPAITIGSSTVTLNGPWRFHVGDDARWASQDYDDSDWETVDLTPAPGAHDGDVGLPGYVTGWSQRGHAGYTGYAWYRLRVMVDGQGGRPLALAGPTLLDSTYELYVDGRLAGGPGDFSGGKATVYSVRPSVYPLPQTSGPGTRTYQLALRVWMDPLDAGDESGGIHVAPAIGSAAAIDALYRAQWRRTFYGYVVDALEPLAFVVLAVVAVSGYRARARSCRGLGNGGAGDGAALVTDASRHIGGGAGTADGGGRIVDRGGGSVDGVGRYVWLAIALVLLALLRVNQVLFYWTPFWSLRNYDMAVTVVLRPLVLGAWVLAWVAWFRVDGVAWLRLGWLRPVVGLLTLLYILTAFAGRPWIMPDTSATTGSIITAVRLAFAALYVWAIIAGLLRDRGVSSWLAALAAVLVGIGLFATELNALGIPGIWFPFGVGVARGQYAYAAFIATLFAILATQRRPRTR
ncbi:hypothetical protein [Luteibacter aegosomatissinici]|uniref:hypothetical protein n=1 Tax=Luteibacter aegosomatissinici TaxID=2911539 RepID=UPI001FF92063|nr:hypothetical protein [Luteibacter aegosomatissinici]UPG96529.1 hypothetical protein L2Y97_10560 [Luteibacter aegosomatissinici]